MTPFAITVMSLVKITEASLFKFVQVQNLQCLVHSISTLVQYKFRMNISSTGCRKKIPGLQNLDSRILLGFM
jgi:hypothetical protein